MPNIIKHFLILIIFTNIFYIQNYYSNQTDNLYTDLSSIPILHNGRVMPLDSLARITLKQLANKSQINNISASKWFIELLLNPSQDYNNKIFYIKNIDLIKKLNLPTSKNKHYSFKQIIPNIKNNIVLIAKLEKKSENQRDNQGTKSLNKLEQDLLDLYHKLLLYFDLSRSLSMFISQVDRAEFFQKFITNSSTVDIEQKTSNINLSEKLSYYQLLSYKNIIKNKTTNILSRANNTDLNNHDSYILSIAKIFKDTKSDNINTNLKIIYYNNNWISPWEATELLSSNNTSKILKQYLNLWQNLNTDFNKDNTESLLSFSAKNYYSKNQADKNLLIHEINYNKHDYFKQALFIYFISLILSFAVLIIHNKKFNFIHKILYFTNIIAFLSATYYLLIGIIYRIIILQRPPVANLYESILFVSLISAVLSIVIEYVLRNKYKQIGLFIGSLVCFFLLIIANSYEDVDNNLGVLIAVLNNNFWLGTHVVTITAGYGSCLILSAIAHISLLKLSFAKDKYIHNNYLIKPILAFTLLSLFLTMLGTILGGIWADQSWGRFWGWDPKENGAMLICLWLIALLHGKVSGQLNNLAFISLAALTSITVAIAWFGVNLLNTGLHSYGFTENIATNLFLFIIFELVFILGLWFLSHKNERNGKKQIL